jgi:hypothetical protein
VLPTVFVENAAVLLVGIMPHDPSPVRDVVLILAFFVKSSIPIPSTSGTVAKTVFPMHLCGLLSVFIPAPGDPIRSTV